MGYYLQESYQDQERPKKGTRRFFLAAPVFDPENFSQVALTQRQMPLENEKSALGLGLFLQTDPILFAAGDVNIYRYCGNRVLNWIDPLGLARECTDWELSEVEQGPIDTTIQRSSKKVTITHRWRETYIFTRTCTNKWTDACGEEHTDPPQEENNSSFNDFSSTTTIGLTNPDAPLNDDVVKNESQVPAEYPKY